MFIHVTLLFQSKLTKNGLNIFIPGIHIEQISSSQSISQGVFKRPQVVIDLAGYEGGELVLLENLVFMQYFTKKTGLLLSPFSIKILPLHFFNGLRYFWPEFVDDAVQLSEGEDLKFRPRFLQERNNSR